jgi:hypothetical protein
MSLVNVISQRHYVCEIPDFSKLILKIEYRMLTLYINKTHNSLPNSPRLNLLHVCIRIGKVDISSSLTRQEMVYNLLSKLRDSSDYTISEYLVHMFA